MSPKFKTMTDLFDKKPNKHPHTFYCMGYPNSGKTELFNHLTNSNYKTGNWPGVTLDKATKRCNLNNDEYAVVSDLPGIYNLNLLDNSIDEDHEAAINMLHKTTEKTCIINIIHSKHLRRQLFLTLQLLETGLPCLIVITHMDQLSESEKTAIFQLDLQKKINCNAVIYTSISTPNLDQLLNAMQQVSSQKNTDLYTSSFPCEVDKTISLIAGLFTTQMNKKLLAIRWLEGDIQVQAYFIKGKITTALKIKKTFEEKQTDSFDVLINEQRYQFIATLYEGQKAMDTLPDENKLDWLLLHPVLGLPLFFIVIYFSLFLVNCLAQTLQESIDLIAHALLMQTPLALINSVSSTNSLLFYLWQPIAKGLITTIDFFPILFFIYVFIRILEQSGYLLRASFVTDKMMGYLNLSGRSVIPLLLGFGCNVPAIKNVRLVQTRHERIFLCMMIPFVSCSARFAVYSVFAMTFFPHGAHNIIFLLYLLGLFLGAVTVLLMKRFVNTTELAPLITEVPQLIIPKIKPIIAHAFYQSLQFMKRAAKAIVFASCLISLLGMIQLTNQGFVVTTIDQSILATSIKKIMFLFAPIGLSESAWPTVVALFSGIFAKEVVIGTLQSVYQVIHPLQHMLTSFPNVGSILYQALLALIQGLYLLPFKLIHPFSLNPLIFTPSEQLQSNLHHAFQNQASVIAYLVFTLLYFPCVSTLIALAQMLSWRWAYYSLLWSNTMAYLTAIIVYQLSNNYSMLPPLIGPILLVLGLSVVLIYYFKESHYAVNTN
jgi:ferrous iron transport protein B